MFMTNKEDLIGQHLEEWRNSPSDAAFSRYLNTVSPEMKAEAYRWHIRQYRVNHPNLDVDSWAERQDMSHALPETWEGSQVALIRKLHADYPEISIRGWESRVGRAVQNGATTIKVRNEFTTTHMKKEESSAEEIWESIEELSSQGIKNMESARWAEIQFNANRYIGVALASDQHIGNSFTDHERMREDADMIRETPNCFVIHAGDFIDNFMTDKPRPSMKQRIPPSVQWKLCNHYLDMFGDKILAVVAGNHDLWTSGLTDYDPLSSKVKSMNVMYHQHELNLRLVLNNIPYNFSIRHMRRGNSSIHPARIVKKMWEDGESDFDVGVIGHHHTPVIEPFTRHGIERWAIRPGSYKAIDSFAEMIGFPADKTTCPMVILSPDKRNIQVFSDLRDGIATLNTLNGGN